MLESQDMTDLDKSYATFRANPTPEAAGTLQQAMLNHALRVAPTIIFRHSPEPRQYSCFEEFQSDWQCWVKQKEHEEPGLKHLDAKHIWEVEGGAT